MRATSNILALAALAGLVIILHVIAPVATPRTVAPAEHARALAWLAAHPEREPTPPCPMPVAPLADAGAECHVDGHADVDGDGLADCWRLAYDHYNMDVREQYTRFRVWRGCTGEGWSADIWHEGLEKLAIPAELASPRWLRFLASRFVDRVACVGCIDAPLTPDWTWVVASANRHSTDYTPDDVRSDAWDGTVAPAWQPLPRPGFTRSALAVVAAPERWLWHLEDGDFHDSLERQRPGAWLVLDAGVRATAAPITCAGVEIVADRGGIVAIDRAHARWAWLFRGLADFGVFDLARFACVDDVVVATSGDYFARIAAIDPRTGGWLFEPPLDYTRAAEVWDTPGGPVWRREARFTVSFAALARWLATPTAARPALAALARAERPELASFDTESWRNIPDTPEPLPEATVPRTLGPALADAGTCAGWTLLFTPTIAIARRPTASRVLDLVLADSAMRITSVRCDGGRAIVARSAGGDLLTTPTPVHDELVIDLARGLWSER